MSNEQLEHWRTFVKAGNATFTVEDGPTGERYTYHVRKCPDKDMWVKVLCGPDNVSNYEYVGTIFGDDFRSTRASRVREDARSFRWFARLNDLMNGDGELPERVRLYHASRCGRCGRRLTVPASVEWGFGPECVLHVFGERPGTDHVPLETAKQIRQLMLAQAKLVKTDEDEDAQ